MFRQAPLILARNRAPIIRSLPSRCFLSTAPPSRTSRSWKNSAARWGAAVGLLYWYNTSHVFAEEAAFPISQPLSPSEETSLPTVDDIASTRAKERRQKEQREREQQQPSSHEDVTASTDTATVSREELEEEVSSEGAYNEETGEINWDCPCLGGMAHGTCGEEFKAAFSCFIYSTDDPKGMNCVDKFQGMQDCFRAHPEEYGDELEREEEDARTEAELEGRERSTGEVESGIHAPGSVANEGAKRAGTEGQQAPLVAGGHKEGENLSIASEAKDSTVDEGPSGRAATGEGEARDPAAQDPTQRAKEAKEQVAKDHPSPISESDAIVPKASHDARSP